MEFTLKLIPYENKGFLLGKLYESIKKITVN